MSAKGMNRRREQLTELERRARALGVTQLSLRQVVHDLVVGQLSTDHWLFAQLWEQADEINKAGLRSQLTFLLDALGERSATKKVEQLGNALEAFTRGATSAAEEPAETEEDLDENGDPWE